jgi:hypothetical protein
MPVSTDIVIEDLKDRNKQLADRLVAMCGQADEDCPSEHRTEHFRATMADAYDYLREIGYLKPATLDK